MGNFKKITVVLAMLTALSGCFKEPVPAYKTVAPETEVYLKESSLQKFTKDALFRQGRVYIKDSGWTNLSARVQSLEPKKITYLNLDRNLITNIDEIVEFSSLKYLRLNNNRLSSIPNLSALKQLKNLHLRANDLSDIPESLKELPFLAILDLSENRKITAIPDWLAKKKNLRHLYLSGTGISTLPGDLSAWESLSILQLGDLKLSEDEMKRIRKALPETLVVF